MIRRSHPVVVVTRTMLCQTYRKVRGSRRMIAFFAVIPAFFGIQLSGVVGTGAYDVGRRLAAGDAGAADEVRAAALSGLVLLSVLGVLGAAGGNSEFKDRYVAFLTATTTRAVALGSVARQTAIWTALFCPAALAAAVAFAVGAGSPVAVVSLAAGTVWLFVVASVLTAPVGFAARWVLDGYDLSGNARFGLGAGMLGLFYLVLFTRERVTTVLGGTPLSWAGDLLLVTVPGAGASPTRAAGFLAVSVALVVVALAASVRLAGAVWYSDHSLQPADDAGETAPDAENRVRDALATVVPRPTAALVEVTWRRTKRTPKTLWYVYPGVFVGLVMGERLVYQGPFSPAMYPAIVAFAGSIAAGSGFTLNPLGTEGDALPGLLTSGASSATVARAKALAVAIPAMPLVVGGTVGVALAVGRTPFAFVVASTAFALALSALAPLLSLALGVHYPPDSEGLFGGSVKIPNRSASAVYTLGMIVVATPGFGAFGMVALSGRLGPAPLAVAVAMTALLALAAGWWSYRHAVARLDAYSVE